MFAKLRSNHSGGGTGGGAGRRLGRPPMLDVEFAGGPIIPTDPGDVDDDGTKFRNLVWVPDDEKVCKAHALG